VWRDLMMALNADRAVTPPPRPPGIEQRAITFANHIEQPRLEYFLAGTGQSQFAAAPAVARRPRITNPVAGTVYAIDPDIPPDRQRIAVNVSGEVTAHHLMLDQRDLGAADSRPQILAPPGPHRLRLIDVGGHVVDQVFFTIR
jgi:penicillin-binding protein 1C